MANLDAMKMSGGNRTLGDQDRLAVHLAEYKSQDDWQRHNEIQRHAISGGLLALTALILSSYKPDTSPNWMPATLIVIGLFGCVVVCKYWERFCYHSDLANDILECIAELLPTTKEPPNQRTSTFDAIKEGRKRHYQRWTGPIYRLYPWFRDREQPEGCTESTVRRGMMQHWLWMALFVLVSILGVLLIAKNDTAIQFINWLFTNFTWYKMPV